MAEVYTDTEAADGLFSDTPEEVQEPESEVPEAPVQSEDPTVPVSSEPDSLDQQADSSGDSSVSTDEETSEGMEEVSTVDPVEQIDYTDLLKQQNQYLESLVMETRETNEHLTDIKHAMPVIVCMLGFVIGVILAQILASYIRP